MWPLVFILYMKRVRRRKASWLTWAELADDAGAGAAPMVRGRVTATSAVWGPFDCQGWAPHPGGNATVPEPECIDARGTEDPRLTFDPETSLYTLIYNAWGDHGAFVAVATTADPTTGPKGWTRYGPIFPIDTKLDGWPGKSGSIVLMASGPHYLIWSCAKKLRITPSIGRSTVRWDANKTTVLFGVRRSPYWDTGDCPTLKKNTAFSSWRICRTTCCYRHLPRSLRPHTPSLE